MQNLYEVLDVPPQASRESIVRAYRQHARASHPDARPDDPSAAARFRTLTTAYEVLSDPVRRAHYDRMRTSAGARSQSGGNRPGQEPLATNGEPRIGGGKAPSVFLDAMPPRSSGRCLSVEGLCVEGLWVGPVRVEASPYEPLAKFRLGSLASLLHGLMSDGWPG